MTATDLTAHVAAIKAKFGGCFGCGMHNDMGLQLDDFTRSGASLACTWRPRPEYQSFPDVVHGGLVTAALDEVMAWTAMLIIDHTVVTGTMDLRFRNPALGHEVFEVTGRLDDHRGKRVMLSSTMTDSTQTQIASAKAMFLTVDRLGVGSSAE